MKENSVSNLTFILYLFMVVVLAVIYFTVPERAGLISNAVDWWKEALDMVL